MMFFSWLFGQKYYPIRYDLKGIAKYTVLALLLYGVSSWIIIDNIVLRLSFRTFLLLIYLIYLIKNDLPLNQIPYIGKLISKK